MYFSQPPKKQYKYKSLSDVYTENVNIMGVDSTGTQEELGAVSDDYYPTLRRLVASKAENGVEALVKQLLRLCDWENIPEDIDDPVLSIMIQYDIDITVLAKIIEKKKAGNLGKLKDCIDQNKKWNLIDAVDPLAKKLTKDFNQMFSRLVKFSPSIGKVGVGPGEVALSMFTNAIKSDVSPTGRAEKGDLTIDGLGLEVKGDGGRLGSSNYTHGIAKEGQNKYIKWLAAMATPRHFSEFEAPQHREAAKGIAASLVTKLTTATKNPPKKGSFSIFNYTATGAQDPFVPATNTKALVTQVKAFIEKLNDLIKNDIPNPVNDKAAIESMWDNIIGTDDPNHTPGGGGVFIQPVTTSKGNVKPNPVEVEKTG